MFQVSADSVMSDALPIEIGEGNDRASQGHADRAGWSLEKRKSTEEVGQQNEKGNAAHNRNVPLPVVSGVLFQNIIDAKTQGILEKELGDLLRGAWALHGETRANPKREQRADQEHQQAHHHVFG